MQPSDDLSDIHCKPWRHRMSTCPRPLGKASDAIDDLRILLRLLSEEELSIDGKVTAGSAREMTVREATRYLVRIGLLGPLPGGRLALTPLATAWLEGGTNTDLIRILHSGVQYIGELLAVLEDSAGQASHEELLVAATSRYMLNWNSLDPIRARTSWLRAAQLVELFDGRVHLTEEARTLLRTLDVADPLQRSEVAHEEPSPTAIPEVATLIKNLNPNSLQRRDRVANYFISLDGSVVLAIQDLVLRLKDRCSYAAFIEYVGKRYEISDSSAGMMLATLRKLGLVERVGVQAFQATALGLAWAEDADRVDLARIAHAKLWGIGEMLNLLGTSPEAGQHLLKMAGLPPNARDRLRLMAECGLIEKVDHARYVITPLGRAVRDTLPCAVISVASSGIVEAVEAESTAENNDVESVIHELQVSARSTDEPARLEQVLGQVLRVLGLADVTVLGQGPGRTDVLATLPKPWNDGTIICFDAKTSSNGPVQETRVSFPGLAEHRTKHGARWSVLVGPEFHPRVHAAAEADGNVTVLDTEFLAYVLQCHAKAPLLPKQLTELFAPRQVEVRLAAFEEHRRGAERIKVTLQSALRSLESEAHEPLDDGWLGPLDIVRICRPQVEFSPDEVRDLLTWVANLPWLGGLEHHKERFRLTATARDILARLYYLGAT